VKRVRHLILDLIVEIIDLLPRTFQIEAAFHDLNSKMVFLVDHQTKLLLSVNRNRASAIGIRVLPADQLTLDQKLPIKRLKRGNINECQISQGIVAGESLSNRRIDVGAVDIIAATNERKICKVSSQPNTAAHDNVALRTNSAKPLAAGRSQIIDFHVGIP
jgi:hypothetical protein